MAATKKSTSSSKRSASKQPSTRTTTPPLSDHGGAAGEPHQVAGDGPILTTQQGTPVARRSEHVATRSPRSGAAGGLSLPREDLPLRPRADPGTGRARPRLWRPRILRDLRVAGRHHAGRHLPTAGRADARPSCGSRRWPGSKGSSDLARDVRGFAVKLYTKEGNWDIVGNNIPVFFIQDAIKFPDLDPRREAGAGPRLSASAVGARQLLGFRVADAGVHAHADVGDVGPGNPAVVPVHGGFRRPHVPVRERRRRVARS